MEHVVLVDEQDNERSTLEKLEAHKQGLLHRAFSVLIYNSKGEILLQKRASTKYHSSGLWTNTCCSHPRPFEDVESAARRRLTEEMGIQCDLNWLFSFQYKITFDNGLTENELDHVFQGITDQIPLCNPQEVSEWQYLDMESLNLRMRESPNEFTHWFHLIMQKLNKEK